MSAEILSFRPFHNARHYARQAGIDDTLALKEIRAEQRKGNDGKHVAGRMQRLASRLSRSNTGGDAA